MASSASFVATSPYLVRGEGSPSAVGVLQGEEEPPGTWSEGGSDSESCAWPEVVRWFCSTGVSSATTDLTPCSASQCTEWSCLVSQPCVMTSYSLLPVCLLLSVSLLLSSLVPTPFKSHMNTRWRLLYNLVLLLCFSSTFVHLAFFVTAVSINAPKATAIYYSAMSLIFLLFVMKTKKCQLQIQSLLQFGVDFCLLTIHALLLALHTTILAKFGAQMDTAVVFTLCLVLQYSLFVCLLSCFFVQTFHAIRRKGFTRMENETYIHDGSDLGTGEKDIGLFTYLTIGWITPLMNRGWYGYINSVNDTYHLPESIDIPKCANILEKELKSELANCKEMNENDEEAGETMYDSHWDHLGNGNVDIADQIVIVDKRKLLSKRKKEVQLRSFSVLRVFLKVYGWMILPQLFLRIAADACSMGSPLLLNLFISYLSEEDAKFSQGAIIGMGMMALALVGVVFDQMYFYQSWKCAFRVRGSFMITIYRKLLQVNQCQISKFSTGEIVNFMSRDAFNISYIPLYLHQFIAMPLNVLAVLVLLYWQVGISFLAGVFLCVLCVPFNQWLSGRILDYDQQYYKCRDKRVKIITEILNGIRTVKLAALESFFAKKVAAIRDIEIVNISKLKYLDAFCVYIWAALPVLLGLAIFSSYSALGNEVTAATVFTVLCYVNLLIGPLNSFPWILNTLIEASVSIKRLNNFYAMKPFNRRSFYSLNDSQNSTLDRSNVSSEHASSPSSSFGQPSPNGSEEKPVLSMRCARFSYGQKVKKLAPVKSALVNGVLKCLCMSHTNDDDDSEPNNKGFQQLQNLELSVGRGQLIGVFGKVGSGKTSLLSAIIGEMNKLDGFITTSESLNGFGYVAQEAWLQTGTIRDNILLGSLFNRPHYERVLRACALVDDLKSLPEKDLTQVGERGITLSGGQKARVTLARALYKDFNVYLLDDPISAVDAHVAAHIYKHCIRGFLRHKTVILCTHHVQYLKEADMALCLEEGRITAIGSPAEVLPESAGDVTEELLEEVSRGKDTKADSEELDLKDRENPHYQAADLFDEEEQNVGDVDWKLYLTYFKACGFVLCVLTFVSLILMQASKNISDWWLTYWTDNINTTLPTHSNASIGFFNFSTTENSSSAPRGTSYSFYHINLLSMNHEYGETYRHLSLPYRVEKEHAGKHVYDYRFYLLIYGLIALSNSVFSLCRAFSFAVANIRASVKIHKHLLDSVLKFKSSIFSVTPVGRIVNRFSSDVSVLDDDLPFIFNIVLGAAFTALGLLVVILLSVPYIIPFVLIMMIVFYRLQVYYRRSSRELRRIATANMSPVYHHFNESLYGASVIKAMRVSELFMKENERRVVRANRGRFNERAVQRWFAIRVQMVSAIILMLAVSFGLFQKQFAPGAIRSGLLGLCLSYCLTIRSTLTQLLATFAENEKNIISVERINDYSDPKKFERLSGTREVSQSWPSKGEINFCNVTLRYSEEEDAPAALKGLSLKIEGGQKVGICGRTGAGKSSVLSVLFRLHEICAGHVFIDGVDIAQVPVRVLRARLSIIPQDPFLFTGTVRENLDQSVDSASRQDDELWQALDRAHMKEAVEKLGGLEAEVGEKGQYFSAGQKQLICLARALLLDTKILCLDEATANVDTETDSKIQATIREEFKDRTVITIAHRINTILHCDKVLVLSDGKLSEEGNPDVLARQSDSAFAQLVAQSGTEIN